MQGKKAISHKSYWEKKYSDGPYDYLIIGAGFSGLWTAVHLKDRFPAARVAVVDSSFMQCKASSRNAGFLTYGNPTEILADIKNYGEEQTFKLISKRLEGIRFIRSFFKKKLEVAGKGGMEIFTKDEEPLYRKTISRLPLVNKHLPREARFYTTKNGEIINDLERAIDPVQLLMLLHREIFERRVILLPGYHVRKLEKKTRWLVITDKETFEADQVILCTNSALGELHENSDVKAAANQVLVLRCKEAHQLQYCIHNNQGYLYARPVDKWHILVGGGRDTYHDQLLEEPKEEISRYLKEWAEKHLLNQETQIIHSWCGWLGINEDKNPVCERSAEGYYVLGGLNGMGVAIAPVLSRTLVEMINE